MSCGPCEEKHRRDRMTRSEFIGAGAAAAAVASMGPMAAAAQSQDQARQAGCDKPDDGACGSDADLEWEVPASVVQVLWGDIFPRFVAYRWVEGSFPPPIPPMNPVVAPAILAQAIQNYIDGLPIPDRQPFERRADVVLAYLNDPLKDHIPIKFTTSGGFDFLVTDAGIELFSPMKPEDRAELLRYYEYRLPGKGTIGIPSYLDEAGALAFDVQSPVSPSQIFIDFLTYTGAGGGPPWSPGCVLQDQENCLDFEIFGGDERREFADFEPAGLPPEPGWIGPVRRITYASYLAAITKPRCWWLEGAVYRGILEQLPRVVATAWREQVLSCTGDTSYTTLLAESDGLRTIFNQRLESSLPPAERMVFELDATISDVTISNQGIRVPDPGAPPALDTMFTAIANGRAGNPVFTDSRRPPNI